MSACLNFAVHFVLNCRVVLSDSTLCQVPACIIKRRSMICVAHVPAMHPFVFFHGICATKAEPYLSKWSYCLVMLPTFLCIMLLLPLPTDTRG